MAVSEDVLRGAVKAVSRVEGLSMDADHLVEDVFLLAFAFPDEDDFQAAVASTVRALRLVIEGSVSSSSLERRLGEWRSFHYQHRVAQGAKADCRIMFKEIEGGIEVKGFGHRRIPKDFYRRISADRNARN